MVRKINLRKILGPNHPPRQNHDRASLERLIFFSDAVFAIAITLLTLDIRLPASDINLTNAELMQNILAITSKYIAYIISFLVIGLIWLGHHRKFRLIQRYDNSLMWINLLLLMTIAFIPFPTSLISTSANQVSTIFYASVMIVASLLSLALWRYAAYKNRLIDPRLGQRQRRRETLSPIVTAAVFLLSIALAFFDAGLARISWILIAVAQFLTNKL